MAVQLNLGRNSLLFIRNHQEHVRCFSFTSAQWKQKKRVPTTVRKVEDVGKSLATKGFLRSIKPYKAPEDAAEKVKSICQSLQASAKDSHTLGSPEEKFHLLEACFREFKHGVPNSQVHEINTVADVVAFYQTNVDTTVPFDALKTMELPENLHIQYDYLRFHPETDTKFNGQTAFPKSSTLVTGLKYRNKYQGHEAKRSWP